MRKRLQKKLYAGPFKTYGFKVIGAFKPETSPETFIDELVAFLDEHLIECAIGYGPGLEFDLYVDAGTRKMNPKKRKHKVCEWLKQNKDIATYETTSLSDAWDYPYQE